MGRLREVETYYMDKKTALWFSSKFNDSLRLLIIEKLEERTKELLELQQKIIERQAKHRLITYEDGTESLRKILREDFPMLKEREVWDYLVAKGIVEYVPRRTRMKVLKDNKYGEQIKDSIRWNVELISPIIYEYLKIKTSDIDLDDE
jgi:hypothetical protein